jgi:hypothetical protein
MKNYSNSDHKQTKKALDYASNDSNTNNSSSQLINISSISLESVNNSYLNSETSESMSGKNNFSAFLPEEDENEIEISNKQIANSETKPDETEMIDTRESRNGTSSTQNPLKQSKIMTKQKLPGFLSIRNNNIALMIMCLCALMQNILVGGANNAILTTIERAYFMTSMESALFLSFYDVANIIASPIIGYFGDRFYKPKILAMSMAGLGLGSLVMIVPEFVSIGTGANLITNSTNSSTDDNQKLCILNDYSFGSSSAKPTSFISDQNPNHLLNYMKYVFYLANMINGVSSVALYTIAVSFLENIFLKDQVNVRQGVYYAIGAIGVGIGMLATGNFLNVNGSFSKSNKMNSSNVNFIGVSFFFSFFCLLKNSYKIMLVKLFLIQ